MVDLTKKPFYLNEEQLHTFINAYGPNRTHIRACIEKSCGKRI